MDAKAKKLWLEALRDPEREQCQKRLKDGPGMCCLGVLLDVAGKGSWNQHDLYEFKGGELLSYLPIDERFGITVLEEVYLIGMNDKGKTFPEIADWIEVYL